MFIEITNPKHIDYSKFNNRKDGVSGFMRVKNEEQFIGKVVLSWIKHVDELIIVYNGCNDKTPFILKKMEKLFPNKIKLYHYLPRVYPFNTKEFRETNENSIHSFCFYSNFALSKTRYKICIKIDGDHIGIQNNLKKTYEYLKKHKMKDYVYYFSGFNLWNFNKKLYFDMNNAYCGNGDVYYFNSHNKHRFIKHPMNKNIEFLRVASIYQYDIGFTFIHTHYMKKNYLKTFRKTNENFVIFHSDNLKKLNYDFSISRISNGRTIRHKIPKHNVLYFDYNQGI